MSPIVTVVAPLNPDKILPAELSLSKEMFICLKAGSCNRASHAARVITPHHDALILTLCINNFDVHKVQLPNERNKAHKIQIQSARFSLVNGQLFKRSLDGLYLKRLTIEQGQYVLVELHEGICGNHPGRGDLIHLTYPGSDN